MAKLGDFLNDLNWKKEYIMDTQNDPLITKDYVPFLINRTLSYFPDTVFLSNEMNKYGSLDKVMQYDFLFHSIRKRKRFSRWSKSVHDDDFKIVQEYYKQSTKKTLEILEILSPEQLSKIRDKMFKGGFG